MSFKLFFKLTSLFNNTFLYLFLKNIVLFSVLCLWYSIFVLQ